MKNGLPSVELADEIRATRAHVESAVHAAKLTHDPAVVLLDCSLMLVDVQHHILQLTEAAAARPPLSEAQVRELAQMVARAADRRSAGLVRAHVERYAAIAMAALVGMALAAGVGAYALAGGFSITCQRQGGGTLCWYWAR